jgi:chromate transport protein
MSTTQRLTHKELSQLFRIFFKIGVTTIGGGYAMIPMMEHEIVKRTGWLTQEEFLDILAVAQATPGIFAVDMAGHIGHKLGGLRGALIASIANVLPSFVIILILATFFQQFKELTLVQNAFRAIRPVVVALIAAPVFSMARSASLSRYTIWIPVLAAILIYFFDVSPVYIILIAGGAGWLYGYLLRRRSNKDAR